MRGFLILYSGFSVFIRILVIGRRDLCRFNFDINLIVFLLFFVYDKECVGKESRGEFY